MSAEFPVFVAAGEALTDLIVQDPQHQRWQALVGGSTWNVARVMARLGLPSAFAGAISQDVFGDALWRASGEAGLDLRFLQRVKRSPLLAIVHETRPPQYFFVGDDSADLHFDAALLPAGWMAQAGWVHFGGISLARQPLSNKLLELAEDLKRAGVRISYDPNYRALMDEAYDATLKRMTALADVVKVSDEDLQGLFRTDDIAAAFDKLRALNPAATYLYTRGAAGASLHVGTASWQARVPPVEVVDTVGAGDASIASLLYSLSQRANLPPAEHLRFAVAGGAAACLGAGASPPGIELIEGLLAQVTVRAG
ncbi:MULTISPECIES: carbohydrate kinase [unclassified Roseateles]|uniref:carbohydrate kinase family protein n=1 Tax=unclassified Roseateles TaxID=2626991 RepID=UPI0006F6933A|nr:MULTISPECIES: carbohydrate kinase [unclassified Roseateles]KQW43233.1 sugar kinase [Pelomonas sp. Root405]KRA70971.1 sugar kinase [Pelomonas sp. Root662]